MPAYRDRFGRDGFRSLSPVLLALLLASMTLSAATAQVVTPAPAASPRFSDTGIVGGTPTVTPQPAPTPSGANTDQHASQFVGTWVLSLGGHSREITLNPDGSIENLLNAEEKASQEQVRKWEIENAAEYDRSLNASPTIKCKSKADREFLPPRWKSEGASLIIESVQKALQHEEREISEGGGIRRIVTHVEQRFETQWVYEGDPANKLTCSELRNRAIDTSDYVITDGVRRDRGSPNTEHKTPAPGITLTRKGPAPDARELAKAELTPSPTATPKPIGTNTPDGRQSLKDALRRDPEYAKMSEAELDAFLDKLDHEQLSSWGVSDAMKAEMDWYTSRGLDPSSPVIKAATPEPTPHAVIQNPYDWVTHARQESELDSAIKQLHDKMKDALEEHRDFSEKNVEELQQRLEVLRHIRNAAIRNPTRYMPRLPARR